MATAVRAIFMIDFAVAKASLVALMVLGKNNYFSFTCVVVLGRLFAKVGPRTVLDGPGSKSNTQITCTVDQF